MDKWNIDAIEALTENEAKDMAEESFEFKGHNVYLVTFDGAFGYSELVYCNGHHIYFANDYELHHPKRAKADLRKWYLERLKDKLYTEEELRAPVKDYTEYSLKRYFILNYYHMREDHISAFNIFHNDEEREAFKRSVKDMYYNPVSFCYMKDRELMDRQQELVTALEKRKDEMNDNYAYWKQAFKYEMANHEYTISWDPDYETLQAFGFVSPRQDNDLNAWFDELKFTPTQRKAYMAARKEILKREVS